MDWAMKTNGVEKAVTPSRLGYLIRRRHSGSRNVGVKMVLLMKIPV